MTTETNLGATEGLPLVKMRPSKEMYGDFLGTLESSEDIQNLSWLFSNKGVFVDSLFSGISLATNEVLSLLVNTGEALWMDLFPHLFGFTDKVEEQKATGGLVDAFGAIDTSIKGAVPVGWTLRYRDYIANLEMKNSAEKIAGNESSGVPQVLRDAANHMREIIVIEAQKIQAEIDRRQKELQEARMISIAVTSGTLDSATAKLDLKSDSMLTELQERKRQLEGALMTLNTNLENMTQIIMSPVERVVKQKSKAFEVTFVN